MQANDLAVEIHGLWDFSDPAGSEQRFRTLLDRLAGDPEGEAVVRTQIARAEGLQRSFEDGHATLDAVEALPAARGARVAVRVALERGRLHNSAGEAGKARPLFVAAFERARDAGEEALAIDAAHMIAIVEPAAAAKAEWNERALALAEASGDPLARRWRASLLNNLGWTRHEEGRFAEALALFEAALVARREQGGAPGPLHVARWAVARAKRSLGRYEEALAAQRTLAAEAAEEDGHVFEEIAECLLALGRGDEARTWFARAHASLAGDPWFAEAEPARLERLRALGGGAGA